MKRTLPLLPVLMVLVLWCLPVAYPDGRIDSDDLLNVAENWQRTGGGPGDFTGDGVVDQADLLYIIQCWKQATSPTSTPTFTFTPTGTGTDISTFTPTITATWTGTSTRTSTPTITLTSTPTPTATPEEIIIDIPGLPEDATPLILVRIPAGEFLMGRYPGEQDSQAYEEPQHRVDIGYDFYIAKYEITKAQWEAIMGTTPWSGKNYILDHPDSPAVYVSWNDIRNAAGFLDRLNALGMGIFRLPSETEWEYACRAGTQTRFYWGDDPDGIHRNDYAWTYSHTTNIGENWAHVVGLKLPNAFGLFDMSGNVAEWCEDWVNDRYNGAPTDGSPWTMGNGAGRIVRGGGVYVDLDDVRSAARAAYTPDSYGHPLGLRVVRSLESAVAHVDSATIGAFLPPSVTQRLSTSNGGMLTGSGTGAVGYHWITEKDGVSVHDSGPLAASMVDGQATLHLYHGFPTALSGLYESFIRITSQSPYLESPRASYTVQDTTALVGYVSLNVFSPLTQLRGAKVSNNGAVYGFDHGRVDYHWTTERDGVVVHDSGPLSVVMKYGAAAIPAYDGFPTNVAGHYTSHIRVTSQSPEWVSLNADYSVISFEGEGVTIDLPGLPADATPLVLVKIPAGSFMMGRYPGENESRANEDPQHRVDIGYDFYIGKYEITKAQWQTMMGTAPWVGGATSTSLVPNAAANWISWNSIREPGGFLDKINALGQGIFRLPSEAEWEYACRACTTTSYYWGDSPMPLNDYAWFRPLPGLGPQGDERDSPTVVGLKLPNPFGLYDIIGNAEEWCEDWWNTGYQGAPTDGSAWRVGDDGNRIARGGGVLSTYSDCRSAYRHWRAPGSLEYWDTGGRVFGFRIVRTVESATANVDSVSVGSFAPPVLNQRDTTSNEGMLHGQGTGAVGYHWLTYKDGQFLHDSGPFVVSMADGQATIPPYDLFPTALPGDYESVIEVTSQSLRLHSATASYTVLPTTGTVDSISISLFSPLTTLQGNPVANYGSFSGSGHGAVEYHWLTERDGAFAHDSGPLTVQMIDGEADIPTYAGFPTDATGHYESYIWVTSQKPEMVSLTADYSVISTAGQNEIVIHLPGLPADATPLVMVRIPAGSFMMGRYPWEVDANSNEAPQHRVDIGYDFYIGKYEITKAQWQAIMGTTPWVGQGTGWNIGPQSPATYVSWDDIRGASGFLDKLNALGQGRFRLPSEAEWEYACRACTPTRYYWGDDPGDKHVGAYAWYVGNHFEDGEFGPHNVGQKIPNNFALFDMSGNVAEWCEDWWNRNYQNAPADGSAWTSGDSTKHVYRGGFFNDIASLGRSARRLTGSSGSPFSAGGFRVVLVIQ